MTVVPGLVRYGVAAVLSIGVNAVVVFSLAELDRPQAFADAHDEHRMSPSVVEPPPPVPPVKSRSAATNAPTALPEAPAAPALDLPQLAGPPDGPGLFLGGLDNVGLGDLATGLMPIRTDAAPSTTTPDEPPHLAVPPDLARFYPPEARRRRLGGRTILRIDVDPRGRVVAAEVLRSIPPGVFDRAAERAARQFRFAPARRNGRAVAGRTRMELKWQPRR